MGVSYSYQMKVPFDMSDVRGRIKLPQLILLSLQVSGMQSLDLGVSDRRLLEEYGLVWIVTDYAIEIQRLPVFDEEIIIETEARSHNRLFCYRSFTIRTKEGQVLVEMLATFVLMNQASRKVEAVLPDIVAPYQSQASKKIYRGPKYPAEIKGDTATFAVRFYDLDLNGHVNNSKYLDWVFEALGTDFLLQHTPTQIDLKYVKEVRGEGNILSLVERDACLSKHQIRSEDGLHAQAIVKWRKEEENEV